MHGIISIDSCSRVGEIQTSGHSPQTAPQAGKNHTNLRIRTGHELRFESRPQEGEPVKIGADSTVWMEGSTRQKKAGAHSAARKPEIACGSRAEAVLRKLLLTKTMLKSAAVSQ